MTFETLTYGYELVEGPRVDAKNRLYFSCSRTGVYRRDPDGQVNRLLERTWVGGIAMSQNGILVTGTTLALVDEAGGVRDVFSEWNGSPIPGFNDLTVDDDGSIFIGAMGFDINTFDPSRQKPPPGKLFRVSPSGEVKLLYDGVMVPNGIGFSPNRKTLYQSDTMTHTVWVYDVDADRDVSDRRIFHRFADDELPDGLAVDAEGGVWVAVAKGRGEIVRLTPEGGIDRRIKVPSTFVTSLAFGGLNLMDLYVVTANNSEVESRGGTVFRTRVDVPGLPVPTAGF
jgi:gluconolactonase